MGGFARVISLLYVDDKPEFLDLVRLFLERKGNFSIRTCQSASDALADLSLNRYDVIVSDYFMPGMDGITLLRAVRKRGDTTPFIMCTGISDASCREESLNAGANFFIVKEGDPHAFFDLLCSAISSLVGDRASGTDPGRDPGKSQGLEDTSPHV